jgi:hypothetical protein
MLYYDKVNIKKNEISSKKNMKMITLILNIKYCGDEKEKKNKKQLINQSLFHCCCASSRPEKLNLIKKTIQCYHFLLPDFWPS